MTDLPADAEHVVIGAGAVGCAVAWTLATSGRRDVVVIEAAGGAALGTTAMGAGMFGLLRADVERVRLDRYSLEVIEELERGPLARPGWERTGSVRIAQSEAG